MDLDQTPLAGRRRLTFSYPGGSEVAGVEMTADELLEVWTAARQIGGVHPVAADAYAGGDGWPTPYRTKDHAFESPLEVLRHAESASRRAFLHQQLERERELEPELAREMIGFVLDECAREVGTSPEPEVIRRAVEESQLPPHLAVERCVLEHVSLTGKLPPDPGHLRWFVPSDDVALHLFPTPSSADALAYLHFWGAYEDSPSVVSVLREWESRYGAHLVAHWGTILQFVVERPPPTLEKAWEVALEQMLVAPCTTMLPGVSLWRHAAALVGRKHWFLHERP